MEESSEEIRTTEPHPVRPAAVWKEVHKHRLTAETPPPPFQTVWMHLLLEPGGGSEAHPRYMNKSIQPHADEADSDLSESLRVTRDKAGNTQKQHTNSQKTTHKTTPKYTKNNTQIHKKQHTQKQHTNTQKTTHKKQHANRQKTKQHTNTHTQKHRKYTKNNTQDWHNPTKPELSGGG